MDFDDLVQELEPPPGRRLHAKGGNEHHFYEGAVMVAYAMHLLRTTDASEVRIHPDGEDGKQFDFSQWLSRRGFSMASRTGTTAYGGSYKNGDGWTVIVKPKSGEGDVAATVGGQLHSAECKGLCETVRSLMATPIVGRQVAVVPYTEGTLRLATRLAPRCALAGISLALVKSRDHRHSSKGRVGQA